jgi:hypothetical protein
MASGNYGDSDQDPWMKVSRATSQGWYDPFNTTPSLSQRTETLEEWRDRAAQMAAKNSILEAELRATRGALPDKGWLEQLVRHSAITAANQMGSHISVHPQVSVGSVNVRNKMPKPGALDAPQMLMGESDMQVVVFFEELEASFKQADVDDDDEKITYLLKFVVPGYRDWVKTLRGYKNGDWTELKGQILKGFNSPHVRSRYTIKDLETLIAEQASKGYASINDLNRRVIKFDVISNHLLENNKAKEETIDRAFFLSIPTDLRDQIQRDLKIQDPTYDTENQAFPRGLVKDAVIQRLTPDWYKPQGTGDGRMLEERLISQVKPEITKNDTDQYGIGELIERLAELDISSDTYVRTYAVLVEKSPSVARCTTPPQPRQVNRPPTPGVGAGEQKRVAASAGATNTSNSSAICYYCGKETCRLGSCQQLASDLEAGYVRRENGYVTYKDGSRLRREGKCLRDDVLSRLHIENGRAQLEQGRSDAPSIDPFSAAYVIQVEQLWDEARGAGAYTLQSMDDPEETSIEDERTEVEELFGALVFSGIDESDAQRVVQIVGLERATRNQAKVAREGAAPYNRTARSARPGGQRKVQIQTPEGNAPSPSPAPVPVTATPTPAATVPTSHKVGHPPKVPAVPEIQMEVDDRRPEVKKATPQFRYTSEVEENANAALMMTKIMGMPLPQGLTLRDLCGVAPVIRRSFTEMCKTKRVPAEPNRRPTDVTTEVVAAPFALREPSYIKPLPKIKFTLNGFNETALLDTGSQVNLFTEEFVQRAGIPVNENHRISMSGVNGQPDQSLGVCEYVAIGFGPVVTKAHYHVFKIAPFAAILGQPFIGDHVIATTDDGFTHRVMLRDFHDINTKVSIALRSSPSPKPIDISVTTNVVMAQGVSAMAYPLNTSDWEAVASGTIEEIDMTDEDWEDLKGEPSFIRQLGALRV